MLKNRAVSLTVVMATVALMASLAVVLAGGLGTIRIDPYLPMGTSSPAQFEVWVKPGGDPTTDPNIFLVMTESCYDGLAGNVTVDWTGDGLSDLNITKDEWTNETELGKKVPPGTVNGAGYTVASLKDHLTTSEAIYWALKPFLDGDITQSHTVFNVTLPSSAPKMLVYVLGKTDGSELFNNRVPPTIPGFVIPEPATIVAAAIPFVALAGYAVVRRKH